MTDLPCLIRDRCGGCPKLHQPVAAQLHDRAAWISRLLGRTPDAVVPSPRSLGYRARVSLRPDGEGLLGYHRPGSHEHVPITACPIARPEIEAALAVLPPLPAGIAEVELRSDGQRVVVSAWRKKRHGKRKRGGVRPVDEEALIGLLGGPITGVALDGRALAGEVQVSLTVGGIRHRLSLQTFYQVNLEVNALLVAEVGRLVTAQSPAQVLDLYAGAGNLSLPLAAAGIKVTLLESATSAMANARRTAAAHSLAVTLRTANANRFSAGDAFFDVVILDPPRAGAQAVIPQLLITRPKAIAYVSCNPPALARDIRPALAAGYRIARLVVFEMFPQTPHAEVLCLLTR